MRYDRQSIIPNTQPLYQQLIDDILQRSRLTEGTYGNPMVWIRRNPHRYHGSFRGYYGDVDNDADDMTDTREPERAYLTTGSGKGSNSWRLGHGTSHSYDTGPTYAAVPTNDTHHEEQQSEDDVQLFMVGELYEPDAESSSATSSDHGSEEIEPTEEANNTERIPVQTSKASMETPYRTTDPTIPTSLSDFQS